MTDEEKKLLATVIEASVGSGLRLALLSDFELANRLIKALVASGALTAEAAEAVLVGTATALEKEAAPAMAAPNSKSMYFQAVLSRLSGYASGLRGVTKKLGAIPVKAAP